jgi:uncharacterized protein YuzE
VQLCYDQHRNIAYLRLREPTGGEIETIRLSDEVNFDIAPDRILFGVELLNANGSDEVAGRKVEEPSPDAA